MKRATLRACRQPQQPPGVSAREVAAHPRTGLARGDRADAGERQREPEG